MTLRITITEQGSRRAFDHVEMPVPTPPPAGPDGGHWKWVGPLPSADVDLGSGLTLVLRVIQTDSVEARERQRDVRGGDNGHSKTSRPAAERPETRCPKCGKVLLGKTGLAPHLRGCDAKPKVTPPVLVSCPTCGKEFGSPSQLGPHRRMAHGYGAGNPRSVRRRDPDRPVDMTGHHASAENEAAGPGFRELALGILTSCHDAPEAVDDARAIRIAHIIREKFHGSFGGEGVPFAEDSDLSPEERAELSVLDGRLIAHRIVGRGRGRSHFWLFKAGGVPATDTVRELTSGVEA